MKYCSIFYIYRIADERINQTGRKVPSSDESNDMNGAVQSIRTSPPSVLPIDTLQVSPCYLV